MTEAPRKMILLNSKEPPRPLTQDASIRLVEKYIRHLLYKYHKTSDYDDLLQKARMNVSRAWEKYDISYGQTFISYCYAAIQRAASARYQYYSRLKRPYEYAIEDLCISNSGISDVEDEDSMVNYKEAFLKDPYDLEEDITHTLEREFVFQMLSLEPSEVQQIVNLYIQGESLRAIGEHLGIHSFTVRKRIDKFVKKCRRGVALKK